MRGAGIRETPSHGLLPVKLLLPATPDGDTVQLCHPHRWHHTLCSLSGVSELMGKGTWEAKAEALTVLFRGAIDSF